MQKTDIIIIGAGPVGLFAIFQAGMLGMNCTIIDALPNIGGQCAELYPEKEIYDIPAIPSITGMDLILQLDKQANPFKPKYILNERVCKFSGSIESGFTVYTDSDKQFKSKIIIIASGGGAFVHRKPDIPNIAEHEERNRIIYSIKDKSIFKDKVIAIAGGGDSAVDWSIILSNIAKKIYFIHRRHKLRCLDESHTQLMGLVENGLIEMMIPYQLDNFIGNNDEMHILSLKHQDGTISDIEVDVLLPFFGLENDPNSIVHDNLCLSNNMIHVDHSNMMTSIPGVYSVGDVCSYPGKQKLILTGFAEVACAMHHIHSILFPNRSIGPHSTSKSHLFK